MVNFKNIIAFLLLSLFIGTYSDDAFAQTKTLVEPSTEQGYADGADLPNTKYGTLTDQSVYVAPTTQSQPATTQATVSSSVSNNAQNPSFCSSDFGIFTELVQTGQMIFNRLRDLIYVVAGFGIIAVAVGGFFGNLNWKWLGAIVISFVVIATAGELIVLMTGCEQFGSSLVTNTLTEPTEVLDSHVNFDDTIVYSLEGFESTTSDTEGVID